MPAIGYDNSEHSSGNWRETDRNLDRKRQVGGHYWRDKLEDAEQITMDLLVDEAEKSKRSKLRKLHDILCELRNYRDGSGD